MFAKWSYTWELMGASWRVLKQDTRLLLFPLLSGICCILVLASFAIPIAMAGGTKVDDIRNADTAHQVMHYAVLFAFYFCNYFVITFFNTALVFCAVVRLQGGEPTLSGGFGEAMKRIHLIAGWALVAATVGMILRMIEERSKLVGRIIAGIIGIAWTMGSYLVVPVLVVEEKGPFEALKTSAGLLRKTWGEQLVGNFSFGLIFFVLMLPGFALAALGIYLSAQTHSAVPLIGGIVMCVLYLLVLSLIQSALQSIFTAAVYLYTLDPRLLTENTGGRGFPVKLLKGAMA